MVVVWLLCWARGCLLGDGIVICLLTFLFIVDCLVDGCFNDVVVLII